MFSKLLNSQTVRAAAVALLFIVLLIAGYFLYGVQPAQAVEVLSPPAEVQMEAEQTLPENQTDRQCDVYIPAGSSWDFETLQAKAAKYGCEVKQFIFGEDEAVDADVSDAS